MLPIPEPHQPGKAGARRVSARSLYLRASSYFSSALYLITHSSAPERFSKSTRAVLHFRGDPYGVASGSPLDLSRRC